ncbi:MAG TPA: metalloregulator ArsR/SmtB family transcription factor [Jiangellaceae bacterium]|nr:metalloregulator ArsR/SmtB family transcription factor [Jiangellaceae bacterium]
MKVPTLRVDAPYVQPERVDLARERALATDELTSLAQLFRLLGDPTRVRLLYALLEVGEMCVSDLAAAVDAQESTVSQALRLLRASGAVVGRRDGRMVFYRLADAHVRMLLDLSREHTRHEEPPR